MKTDHILSIISRHFRPSLRQPHPAYRSLSQLAPLRHPKFQRPSDAPRPSTPKNLFPFRSLQIRQLFDSSPPPSSAVAQSPDYASNTQTPLEKAPAYELTFTCKPCKHRSTHTVSKQGYHKGTVLITCPECSNRHVISDHLKVGFQSLCATDAKLKRFEVMNADI